MKKTFCAVLVLGFMAIAGTASALPPVQLDPMTCDAWNAFDGIAGGLWTGTNAIWDAVGFLSWNGEAMEPDPDVPGFPLTWEASDLENGFAGDGLADRLQLALLAAVLCAGDPGVSAQYAANAEAYAGMIGQFYATITAAGPLATTLGADGPALQAVADYYRAMIGEAMYAQLSAVAAGMADASALLADFVGRFSMYVPIFEGLGPWFIGMAGTSAAMDASIEGLMFNEDYGIVADLGPAGEGLAELAGYLHGTAAGLVAMIGPNPVSTALEADADGLDALVAILVGITWPDMAIYGVAKTETEPFSGEGDYNGNGDTNAEVAAAVGSDPEAFVAAASGANVWYTGNPALPVAGIFGLALLAGACVMGGAASIRRK